MESKLEFDGKLEDNLVHKQGSLLITPKKEDKTLVEKLLEMIGFLDLYRFPAEVDEAADWREGSEITIKVINEEKA